MASQQPPHLVQSWPLDSLCTRYSISQVLVTLLVRLWRLRSSSIVRSLLTSSQSGLSTASEVITLKVDLLCVHAAGNLASHLLGLGFSPSGLQVVPDLNLDLQLAWYFWAWPLSSWPRARPSTSRTWPLCRPRVRARRTSCFGLGRPHSWLPILDLTTA